LREKQMSLATEKRKEKTVPERPETLAAQARWLSERKRNAVLVTPGEVLPEFPLWVELAMTEYGLLAWNPEAWTRKDILELVRAGLMGVVLGYGIDRKPEGCDRVVVVRGSDGLEKQAVVTDAKHEARVVERAHAVKDAGDTVRLEDAAVVLAQRKGELLATSFPEIRLIQSEVEMEAVTVAAEADGTVCLAPSHLIERDGRIIGYVGMDSIPLFRVWLHSEALRPRESFTILNVVENLYRARGVRAVSMLLMPGSPFGELMPRLGYERVGETVLHSKRL
jgi:hypothetical protein